MPENQKISMNMLSNALTTTPIISTFPSIEIALKIFTCSPCSNSSGERSFSVLKRVKTYLRSSLSNEKTSCSSVLCMEAEIVKTIDWSELVNTFAKRKARKKNVIICSFKMQSNKIKLKFFHYSNCMIA